MPPAILPHNEESRLAALVQQEILDTPDEAEFDALTRLAAELCDAPIALISLVDRDRQWFKSRTGLDVSETPRDIGFCARAILGEGILEIEDTFADRRFAENPLVTGPPGVRFYAAAPLRDHEGHAFGTLCVMDRTPRRLSDAQRSGLRALARQVISQMRLRRTLLQIQESVPRGQSSEVYPETTTVDAAQPRSRRALTAPRRFGRFVVLDAIGHGAMATVYAGFDEELQRKIAVKLLHPSTDRESHLAVQREAQTLARVSHPNVVQVHDAGMLGDQAFIAMEYIAGVTLTVWQHAHPRGLGELLAMYVQTGRGLVAAHAAGVVHPAYKPKTRSPLGRSPFSPSGRILKFRGVLRQGPWRVMPRHAAVLATDWQHRRSLRSTWRTDSDRVRGARRPRVIPSGSLTVKSVGLDPPSTCRSPR
jgi:hypothetical protein